MNLFFLTSDLGANDAAEQLALLACSLPRDRFSVTVGVLDSAIGVASDSIRAAGIAVHTLPVRGALDFSGMRKLRRAVAESQAKVIHAFGAAAVRAARLCVVRNGENYLPHVIATNALDNEGGMSGWFTARQVRRADRVIATGWSEGEAYQKLGVKGERLTRIAPAIVLPQTVPDRAAFCEEVKAPANAKFIFAGGKLDAAHGIKDAVTAFDMLRYISPQFQLVLTGDGPERTLAEQLGHALAFDDFRIRFTGSRGNIGELTQLADQVWVTCARGGELLALRGMAAGKPVIAFETRELADIIDDGITGYLVPPGDRAAMATKAQMLFAYPENAARMGEAGRARAAERFGLTRLIEQHERVYRELTE